MGLQEENSPRARDGGSLYSWAREHGKNVHLSVGGLDSITLHYFLESIGLPVTCISCSSLEGRGVQEVHKRIAQEMSAEYKDWMGDGEAPAFVFLKPLKNKVQILQECGWPVISKEKAGKIALLQNPPQKRHSSPRYYHRRNGRVWRFSQKYPHEVAAKVA